MTDPTSDPERRQASTRKKVHACPKCGWIYTDRTPGFVPISCFYYDAEMEFINPPRGDIREC